MTTQNSLDLGGGFWCLMTLADGTQLVGRVKDVTSIQDFIQAKSSWFQVEEACTYHVQMAQVQGGGQAIFAMCLPYAASPDESIGTYVSSANIVAVCPFDSMPAKMQKSMVSKVKEVKQTAARLAAANAGLSLR